MPVLLKKKTLEIIKEFALFHYEKMHRTISDLLSAKRNFSVLKHSVSSHHFFNQTQYIISIKLPAYPPIRESD